MGPNQVPPRKTVEVSMHERLSGEVGKGASVGFMGISLPWIPYVFFFFFVF